MKQNTHLHADYTEYFSLRRMIEEIDEPNRTAALRMLAHEQVQCARGSSANHQAYAGGYLDHLIEVLNFVVLYFFTLDCRRPFRQCLPPEQRFSLSDALLAAFLHDAEKPWKYTILGKLRKHLDDKANQCHLRGRVVKRFGFELPARVQEAIDHAEGEVGDHTSDQRQMSPLATLVHIADVTSARMFPNYPCEELPDSWCENR